MQSQKKYKRIVIKIGSSMFYDKGEPMVFRSFEAISQLAELMQGENKELIIVSSGAIALGMDLLKLATRPKQLPLLQAAAAVGQNELMNNYREHFKRFGLSCAQILLTWDDFTDRKRYLNAKNTLNALIKLKSVPVINENDTVSTDEIKFGDNDRLSALVAKLVEADLLIIFSNVDGLLDRNNQVIPIVTDINTEIKSLVCPTKNRTCVGGMAAKLEAARIAVDSGIPCVIANGNRVKEYLGRILSFAVNSPERIGTLFLSKKNLSAKEHWMAFVTKPKGKIVVDDGAKKALLNKKSLLSVGIVSCSGNFSSGDVVSICNNNDVEFARGKAGLAVKELEKIKGIRFDKEIIHRDNIVIL
ncbi:MAG: glutamate 5-kinase [Candidatus Omnitrophica bacterium]|nr:glutamate 5-kinase [Candidatus Omnitrophota bacterium]